MQSKLANSYLVHRERRFSEVTPGALYEKQVENVVHKNVGQIMPGYESWQFEPLIRTPGGDTKPDLIFVNLEQNVWFLVEVEVETHSFRSHILPQISKMRRCEDGEEVIDQYLNLGNTLNSEVDYRELFERRPGVLLITHGTSEHFSYEIEALGVERIDLSIFQCSDGPYDPILRIQDRASVLVDTGVYASRGTGAWNRHWTLTRDITNIDNVNSGNSVVHYGGHVGIWKTMRLGGSTLLVPPGEFEIEADAVKAKVYVDNDSNEIHFIPWKD